MKVDQEAKFSPITIVLETADEAEILWRAIREVIPDTPIDRKFINELSDWFSLKAHL
jgi:hypothetical protein